MHHIHIILTGIVALVSAMNGDPTTAILPNASQPSIATDGSIIPAHVAWLVVEPGQLAEGSAAPDQIIDRGGTRLAVYRLRGETVLPGAKATQPDLAFVDGVPGTGETPGETNRRYLHWVARMRDILSGDHPLNAAYFQHYPSPELVAARLQLDRGELSVDAVSSDVWEFRPKVGSSFRQALAQQVDYSFDVTAPFSIVLRSFRSGQERVIRFVDADIRLMIGNSTEEDIAAIGPHHHDLVDNHFQIYYRFYESPPAVMPLPYLVSADRPRRLRAASSSLGGGNCPPTQWP